MTCDPRTARIEKLAGEAESLLYAHIFNSARANWICTHATELATLLRELKTRIEAEEGGGL